MAGFDALDPETEKALGYRSRVLMNSTSVVSYNGYKFPPALHSSVTVVPEYNEAGTSVKYLTVALSIEFVSTNEAYTDLEFHSLSQQDQKTETHTSQVSLRDRLTQPCQSLEFSASGYGNFVVNTPSSVYNLTDVDYGPKPQVVEWEPLGGARAARIQWLCVTRIPPHKHSNGSFVQLDYSVQWGIDNAGFMIRSIEGFIEIPLTRTPNQTNIHASNSLIFAEHKFNLLRDHILKAFPELWGFKRQYFYRIKNNRKIITFRVEDTEIRSDSPFFPGISNVQVSENVLSSLDEGGGAFRKWRITYSGSIEVVKSKKNSVSVFDNKKLAWVWLTKMLQERRKQFQGIVEDRAAVQKTVSNMVPLIKTMEELDSFTANTFDEYTPVFGTNVECVIYPVLVSITDEIYDNIILFTISYAAVITSDLIIQSSGLFQPLKTDQLDKSTHVKYIQDTNAHDPSVQPYQSQEYIIDMCSPVIVSQETTQSSAVPTLRDKRNSLFAVTQPENGRDWLYYDIDFYYLDKSQNVIGTSLHNRPEEVAELFPIQSNTQTIDDEMKNNPFRNKDIVDSVSNPDNYKEEVKVYSPTPNVCFIRMTGNAARFNGSITPPVLVGVGEGITLNASGKGVILPANEHLGGALAKKYGQDIVKRKTTRTGLTDQRGKPINKVECYWVKTYILDRPPRSGKAFTTGIPQRFENDFHM